MPDRPVRLRLTPFEHYMLADDRLSHPMSFHMRFGVEGPIDLARFERAVDTSVSLHPLFAATVLRDQRHWFWNLGTTTPRVEVHSLGSYSTSRSDWFIDLTRETGLRVSVAQEGKRAEIFLQVHHCCSDGRGCLDFMQDVLAAYEVDSRQHNSSPALTAQGQLSMRAARERRSSSRAYLWPLSQPWKRIGLYYVHPTQALPCASAEPSPEILPFSLNYLCRKVPFSLEAWRKKRVAKDFHATINDLLLLAVFKCLGRQYAETGGARPHAWLRVAVPIDQRTPCDTRSPASNCSSMVFIDRHTKKIADSKNLLRTISKEMECVKSHHLGSVLCDVLRVLDSVPKGMRLATENRRCAVTTVLSNLGELDASLAKKTADSSGRQENKVSLNLHDLNVLVPLRPGTTVSIGVITYREQLHLSLNYDNRHLSKAAAIQFFDHLCNEVAGI